jgi:cysteine-rich repeat protein
MSKTILNRMTCRRLGAVGLFLAACLLSGSPAAAHQSPAGCTGNNLGLDLFKNKTQIVSGDTVHFTVRVRNDAAGACDVTGANVTFTCPASDGTPTGAATLCAGGASFAAGFPPTTICEVDCVITVNPGVTSAQAKGEVHGTLHDTPVNDLDTADVVKFVSVQILRCGDGLVNLPGETCDPPGSVAGASGNLCRTDCTVCGDGHMNGGEQCDDGNNVNGDGCENNCTPTPRCGDGLVNLPGETCDPPGSVAGASGNLCRADCTVCGDGHMNGGEQCDDGNNVNGDGCENNCTPTSRCGDGIVGPGETCDPPGSVAGASGNLCRPDCTVCGDGHMNGGEQCDDGNNVNGDGCENNCTPTSRCGDGIVGPGEECDDGNNLDGDGCSSTCQNEGGFCPNFNPEFGAAGDCTILNFGGSFTSTGPSGQYQGDLCIADSAHASFSGSNFVTGQVRLAPNATCTGCTPQRVLGGVVPNADLTAEVQACQDARENNTPVSLGGGGPECTETVTTLQSIAVDGTITRSGTNVICLTQNQTVKGLNLAGDATTKYVFIVEKQFKFQDGKIQTVAPVGPDDVLWLFVGDAQSLTSSGGGGGASCCKAAIDGSVIIDGKIALAPGLINGQVCGTGGWQFVSGSGVHCPPEQ